MAGALLKAHVGGSFQAKPVKWWNGSAWITKPLKMWDGSAWVGGVAAAPAFRAQSFENYTTNRTEAVITKPAGTVDNDILIATLFLGRPGSTPADATPTAGWSLIARQLPAGGGFSGNCAVYWKRAAAEGASWTFTFDTNYNFESHVAAYSGCITSGSPIDNFSQNMGNTAVATSLGFNTTKDNDLLLYAGNNWDATGTLNPPAGMTERHDNITYQADLALTTPGATGDKTQNMVGSNPWSAFLIALRSN